VTVHPSKNNAVYKLTATNAAGSQSATKTIVIDAPAIASFAASPEAVAAGSEARLKWSAQGHTKLTLKASKGEIADGKSEIVLPTDAVDQTVRPLEDTEYTLTATNAGGADAKTVKVIASPMAVVLFKAEPASIAKGEQTQLSWNVTGASSNVIQPGVGAVAQGETSRLVKPDATTEYTLTATGADGKKLEKKATVTVGLAGVKVDVFSAAPASVAKGESVILNFGVQNAKKIVIADSDGRQVHAREVPAGQSSSVGNINVSPEKTTVYTLTASNDSGQAIASATVVILPPTPTAKPAAPPAPAPAPKP
jgi:phospholipase C